MKVNAWGFALNIFSIVVNLWSAWINVQAYMKTHNPLNLVVFVILVLCLVALGWALHQNIKRLGN